MYKNNVYCRWYDNHDRLQKLNQQATLDASKGREEYIKDQLISYGKVVKQLSPQQLCLNI
jgi:hypothetical protein